jgi:hypothetical protein
LRSYAEQNEVRFKVTDKKVETYRDTALYLYEYNLMEKPNIHSFGDGVWSMSVTNIDNQSLSQKF